MIEQLALRIPEGKNDQYEIFKDMSSETVRQIKLQLEANKLEKRVTKKAPKKSDVYGDLKKLQLKMFGKGQVSSLSDEEREDGKRVMLVDTGVRGGPYSGDRSIFFNPTFDPLLSPAKVADQQTMDHCHSELLKVEYYDENWNYMASSIQKFRYEPAMKNNTMAHPLELEGSDKLEITREKGGSFLLMENGVEVPLVGDGESGDGVQRHIYFMTKEISRSQVNGVESKEYRKRRTGLAKHTLQHWHSIFNHADKEAVRRSIENSVGGLIVSGPKQECPTCLVTKARRQGANTKDPHAKNIVEQLLGRGSTEGISQSAVLKFHQDMIKAAAKLKPTKHSKFGDVNPDWRKRFVQREHPMQTLSCDLVPIKLGELQSYLHVIVCCSTRYMWVFHHTEKSQVVESLEKVINFSRMYRHRIAQIITDDAGEYRSEKEDKWRQVCAKNHILATRTMPRTQRANPVERHVQVFMSRWTTALHHALLPVRVFAMLTVQEVVRRMNYTARQAINWESPYYRMFNSHPDLSSLFVIGSLCVLMKPSSHIKGGGMYHKLGPKGVWAIYLGTDQAGGQGHEVYRLDTGQVSRSDDVAVEDQVQPRVTVLKELRAQLGHIDFDTAIEVINRQHNPDQAVKLEEVVMGKPIGETGLAMPPEVGIRSRNQSTAVAGVPVDLLGEAILRARLKKPVIKTEPSQGALPKVTVDDITDAEPPEEKTVESEEPRRGEGVDQKVDSKIKDVSFDQDLPSDPERTTQKPHVRRNPSRRGRGVPKAILAPPDEYRGGYDSKGYARSLREEPPEIYIYAVEEVLTDQDHITGTEADDCSAIIDILHYDQGGDRIVSYTQRQLLAEPVGPLLDTERDRRLRASREDDNQGRVGSVSDKDTGLSYREAISDNPDAAEANAFRLALKKEFQDGLLGGGIIKFVHEREVPRDARIVPMLLTFLRKRHVTGPLKGLVRMWKARACLRGDIQNKYLSIEQRYANRAPTADLSVCRALMAMSKDEGVFSLSADYSLAFTNATPGNETYCSSPQGCHRYAANGRKMFLRLCKNLYGSSDACLRWCNLAFNLLKLVGLSQSLYDPCLWRACKSTKQFEIEMEEFERNPEMDMEHKGVDPTEVEDDKTYLYAVGEEQPEEVLQLANAPDPGQVLAENDLEMSDAQAAAEEHSHYYFSHSDITPTVSPVELSTLIAAQPKNFETVKGEFSEELPNGRDLPTDFVMLVIYVDDTFIISSSKKVLLYLRKRLLTLYKGTYEDNPSVFLGQVLTYHKNGDLMLSQDALIKKSLMNNGFSDLKHSRQGRVPIREFIEPQVNEEKSPSHRRLRCKGKMDMMVLLGEIGYIAHTHPYIKFAHGQLARIMTRPQDEHFRIAKNMMRYMVGRLGHGVTFRKDMPQDLFIYVDSNFGVTNYTGIAVFLNGGCIYSKSLRQKYASRSSYESELSGISEGVRIALYYRAIARDLGMNIEKAVVFNDNEAAVNESRAAHSGGGTSKLRHHMIRNNWVKQQFQRGLVDIIHVRTEDNVADILTKPITSEEKWDDLYAQLMGECRARSIVKYVDDQAAAEKTD